MVSSPAGTAPSSSICSGSSVWSVSAREEGEERGGEGERGEGGRERGGRERKKVQMEVCVKKQFPLLT